MFRHPHLVVLMGFARNGPKRFLVQVASGGAGIRDLAISGPKSGGPFEG